MMRKKNWTHISFLYSTYPF